MKADCSFLLMSTSNLFHSSAQTALLEEMSSLWVIMCCYRTWLDVVVMTLLHCVMFTSSSLRIFLTSVNIMQKNCSGKSLCIHVFHNTVHSIVAYV